jgi:hypothetical protein
MFGEILFWVVAIVFVLGVWARHCDSEPYTSEEFMKKMKEW